MRIEVDEQRSDWGKRPLSARQLEYAIADVRYLLSLRGKLGDQLAARGLLAEAEAEFARLIAKEARPREFDPEGYRRIKGSKDLTVQELAVLRALYVLRDRYARELDVPPFKVLNNPVLIDLSRKPPQSPRDMFHRSGISYRVARKYAGEVFRAIERARADESETDLVIGGRCPENGSRTDQLVHHRRPGLAEKLPSVVCHIHLTLVAKKTS